MPVNVQLHVEAQSARALARVWADSAYWRAHYARERDFWRRGALEMFTHITGMSGDAAAAALDGIRKVPWIVSAREEWISDAAAELLFQMHLAA